MQYNKKGQKSLIKGHNCEFLPLILLNLRHLERYTPLNDMLVLKVLTKNKEFYFSKRALHAGTAPNKWLKETLNVVSIALKGWLL